MSSIDIGNKVKELMKKNKMTNLELAKLLNIEEQELSEKLSGKEEFLATEATKISNIFNKYIHRNQKILHRLIPQDIVDYSLKICTNCANCVINALTTI